MLLQLHAKHRKQCTQNRAREKKLHYCGWNTKHVAKHSIVYSSTPKDKNDRVDIERLCNNNSHKYTQVAKKCTSKPIFGILEGETQTGRDYALLAKWNTRAR